MAIPTWHWSLQPDADTIKTSIANSKRGRHLTPEHRAKIGNAQRGKPHPHLGSFTGVHHTDETKERIAAAKRGRPHPARRSRPELFDSAWVKAQYRHKSITEIAADLNVSDQTAYRALKRFGIEITRAEHASRAGKTSPKAVAQRRSLSYQWPSNLQRQLGMILYRLGFTDIQHEKPFYTFNVDWYSPSQHLAFEADGSFHQLPQHQEHDRRRDKFLLACYSLPVIRLDTNDIRRLAKAVL